MNKFLNFSLSAFFALFSFPLHADDLFIQVERLEQCIQFSSNKYECIGITVGACSDLPSGGSIEGMTSCVAQERQFWLDLTDDTLARLMKMTETGEGVGSLADGLNAMQMGWVEFRNALRENKITAEPDGKLREANCLMRQDGEQALYLLGLEDEHF